MAHIVAVHGITPTIANDAWVADNATITGDVTIGSHSSIWYQVVIRGDVNTIKIGAHTNIQDASIIHGSTDGIDTVIGNRVSVGHRAIVHGCTIADDVLIGMGAIVLDEVTIPPHVIIAAGAVVTGGQTLESGYIYAGIPAKKVKKLTAELVHQYITQTARGYIENKELYR